jgi:Cu/Zn superoxide dismutase
MSRLLHSLFLGIFMLCSFQDAKADHLTAKFLFAARLNGTQEVPALTNNGLGVATFTLNSTADTMCVTMTVNALSGPITGVHIHEGKAGVSGPVIVNLVPFLSGNSLQATIAGSSLGGLSLVKLFSGDYYINVHTAANAGGEVRGQILAEQDQGFAVRLSGTNEVPAVTTNAKGLAFFMLSQHTRKLSFYVVLDSLNGTITGAHLHRNVAGANGPVIQDLMPFLSGNVISGSVDPSAYLSSLLADSLYINVHTAVNPSGSIRGQLRVQPYLFFDARMNGAQEVPAVPTSAVGLGIFMVNYALDSLWYDVQMSGLSGAVSASHIHRAAAGVSGPVVVPFPAASIVGNTITGSTPLPSGGFVDSLKRSLLDGSFYINAHTAANPPGEIRGQIYRTLREGYTFSITGDQEVPAVSTAAYGSGMVSIDRDQTNAHFMIVATSISPTAAHFHQAVAGVSGPVIFDLASFMNNGGIYGYWYDTLSTSPFSAAISNKFRKDSVYVNYHTAVNASGEIRGQAQRSLCVNLPKATAVETVGRELVSLAVYPNPASDVVSIGLQSSRPIRARLQLIDITGRTIREIPETLYTGSQTVRLPLGAIHAGLYYVVFSTEEGRLVRKVLKQ